MTKIVLLGPPGSGKGTQAKKLQECLNVVHISVGDLLREAVAAKTAAGNAAAEFMAAGKLVPDEISIALTNARLAQADCKEGFLLDGYPRNLAQAEALQNILRKLSYTLDAVLYIEVPIESIIERLSGRRSCKNCGAVYHVKFAPPKKEGICDCCGQVLVLRKDDVPEVIRTRFNVYCEQTEPLVAFYRQQGLLKEIDGSRNVDEIFDSIKKALGIK
ncbi:MAG: adenylate kinase [Candidatus Margulisiibacteriota bacterium]